MSCSATSTGFLNTSRDGNSTTSLSSLFQCLTTLSVKKFFLISNLNLPWHNLRPLPLVLSLGLQEAVPAQGCPRASSHPALPRASGGRVLGPGLSPFHACPGAAWGSRALLHSPLAGPLAAGCHLPRASVPHGYSHGARGCLFGFRVLRPGSHPSIWRGLATIPPSLFSCSFEPYCDEYCTENVVSIS